MTTLGALKEVEDDASAEFQHFRVPLLLARFASGYVAALGVSLASSGWHVAGLAALWSLLAGAGLAAVERALPSVPWAALLQVVRDAQAMARISGAPPRPGVSTPTLKAPDRLP